jgi:hypothetical protein
MKKGGTLLTVAAELMASDSDEEEDGRRGVGRSFSVSKRKLMGQVFVKKERFSGTQEPGRLLH